MKQMMYLQVNKLVSAALATAVVGALACSSVPEAAQGNDSAKPSVQKVTTSRVESAIVSNCRLSTVGLPCDPDGDGAASECEGLCWIDDAALVSCLPVAAVNRTVTDLNGRICGDVEGRDCGRSCENGACVDKNARLGTACRPSNNSSTCEGVCTLIGGEPACDEITVCSNVGISEDGCSLTACDFDSFETGCEVFELENAVCTASQIPVIEAGVSSETPDAATRSDAAASMVDAAASMVDAASEAGVDAASDVTSAPAETTAATEGAVDAAVSRVDAGGLVTTTDRDGGEIADLPKPATKVVGGACSTAPGRAGTSGIAMLLAAIGLVGVRRTRSRLRR